MNYKKLKIKLNTQKQMREHYQTLYNICLEELKFEKLQNDFLVSALNEVENLCDKKVKHKLIAEVIRNSKERRFIDKIIHNDLIS